MPDQGGEDEERDVGALHLARRSSEGERDVELHDVVALLRHRIVEGAGVGQPGAEPVLLPDLEVEARAEPER